MDCGKIESSDDDGGKREINLGIDAHMQRIASQKIIYRAVDNDDTNSDTVKNKYSRIMNFDAGLRRAVEAGHRPHMLYGSMEASCHLPVKVLPPLSFSFAEEYNPLQGNLSYEGDRKKIRELMLQLEPFLKKKRSKTEYTGERDSSGAPHGFGRVSRCLRIVVAKKMEN